MQLIPAALGEADDTLVIWDDCPDIGIALPRSTQVIASLEWGAGTLDEGEDCLILYVFFGEDHLEIYLSESLPTAPDMDVAVWSLLLRRDPEVLKVRYGATPAAREQEVTLLLPTREGERMADRLRMFAERLNRVEGDLQKSEQDFAPAAQVSETADATLTSLRVRLGALLEEVPHASRES